MISSRPWIARAHFFNETLTTDVVARALADWLANPRAPHLVADYEREVARCHGMPPESAVALGGGRMALWAILEAMGIGAGDEVLLPAFTCEVVPHALLYRGIRPRYVDIETDSFGPAPESIEAAIGPRTRAVIAQHSFGAPCRIEEIVSIAERRGIRVIEDCALGFGSTVGTRMVGTFGDAAFFSSDRTKVYSTIAGGLALARDPDLAASIRAAAGGAAGVGARYALEAITSSVLHRPTVYPVGRNAVAVAYRLGLFRDLPENTVTFQRPDGYPRRLTSFQAALGLRQLQGLDAQLRDRARTVAEYREIIDANGLEIPRPPHDFVLRFPILHRDPAAFRRRWRRTLETGNWFSSPAFGWRGPLERVGYGAGTCPRAEQAHAHIINLPTLLRASRMRAHLHDIVASMEPGDIFVAR